MRRCVLLGAIISGRLHSWRGHRGVPPLMTASARFIYRASAVFEATTPTIWS
jgi:hypothetical protein